MVLRTLDRNPSHLSRVGPAWTSFGLQEPEVQQDCEGDPYGGYDFLYRLCDLGER